MAKIKLTTPITNVVKKDNTRVARNFTNQTIGEKIEYKGLGSLDNPTKVDSASYERGFRKQVLADKKAKKQTEVPKYIVKGPEYAGREEAYFRRLLRPESLKSLTRDSSIPLAPTQFPE